MFGSNDNYHSKLFFNQSFLVKINKLLLPKNSDKIALYGVMDRIHLLENCKCLNRSVRLSKIFRPMCTVH